MIIIVAKAVYVIIGLEGSNEDLKTKLRKVVTGKGN